MIKCTLTARLYALLYYSLLFGAQRFSVIVAFRTQKKSLKGDGNPHSSQSSHKVLLQPRPWQQHNSYTFLYHLLNLQTDLTTVFSFSNNVVSEPNKNIEKKHGWEQQKRSQKHTKKKKKKDFFSCLLENLLHKKSPILGKKKLLSFQHRIVFFHGWDLAIRNFPKSGDFLEHLDTRHRKKKESFETGKFAKLAIFGLDGLFFSCEIFAKKISEKIEKRWPDHQILPSCDVVCAVWSSPRPQKMNQRSQNKIHLSKFHLQSLMLLFLPQQFVFYLDFQLSQQQQKRIDQANHPQSIKPITFKAACRSACCVSSARREDVKQNEVPMISPWLHTKWASRINGWWDPVYCNK